MLAINQGWATPWLDALFGWVSQKALFSIPLLLLILALLVVRWRVAGLKLWLALIATILVGDLLGNVIKHLVLQYRPCAAAPELVRMVRAPFDIGCNPKPFGMPSNHALDFFVATTFLAFLLHSWGWAVAMGSIATVVALARVYLGVHYPTQVLAGIVAGAAIGYFAARLVRRHFIFARQFVTEGSQIGAPNPSL